MKRQREAAPELAQARRAGLHNIGQAARASGVSAKMIRYYESVGLIPRATRTVANYRLYGDADVHTLRFIRRARDLGFPMKQIQALLTLWTGKRPAREVRQLALEHVQELEQRIRELDAVCRTLTELANRCLGHDQPECPILDDLSGTAGDAPDTAT